MEIKLQAKELLEKLEQLAKVVPSRTVMPILNDVLIEAKGDVVLLTASDSEMWLSLKCGLQKSCEELRICVNAADILSLIKNLGDRPLSMSINTEGSSVTCDYGIGKFTLPYDNPDEFPKASMNSDGLTDIIVDSSKMLNAIEKTRFAAADDDKLIPVINGVYFDFISDGMVSVATNKQKAAMTRDKEVVIPNGEEKGFTVPKKSASVLSSILSTIDGDVKISFNDSSVHVNNKDFKLSSRLLEYKYPNYALLFKNESMCTATIDKESLLLALKRVTPASNELSNLVIFNFTQGSVTLSTESAELGKSANETVTCDCDGEIRIGFKSNVIMEILKNLDDENIVIELSGEKMPAAFYTAFEHSREEFITVCMPMIIQ